ncbi:helix-turn-helix domain-containing protein [Gryllotalpicola protaetiae]|uniref:XRE family transcriptional regulator n=1 Tax=Gryllotalpicola protaetiae TaxID=2419771 RepID=A0A387BS31_9MICO|nr:helix-turn-helix transcriptional regulator [Gryllotalpicola protaetiae]AYG03869.1 XRE family transcriptional regulator [Gryllotalpicola protaetiae]
MTDFRGADGIGTRIKLARRERGFRTTRELAEAVPDGNVSPAVLENIESGRKADISVSQLLNIARALDVPPSLLLAPVARPEALLDLPNLSADFNGMTSAEFDSWFSSSPAGYYRPRLAAERADIELLGSLRELGVLRRELERLQIIKDVSTGAGDADLVAGLPAIDKRIEALTGEAARLAGLLSSAGVVSVDETPLITAPDQPEPSQ